MRSAKRSKTWALDLKADKDAGAGKPKKIGDEIGGFALFFASKVFAEWVR